MRPAGEALALPGLRNSLGEYNCFLNVVVQVGLQVVVGCNVMDARRLLHSMLEERPAIAA